MDSFERAERLTMGACFLAIGIFSVAKGVKGARARAAGRAEALAKVETKPKASPPPRRTYKTRPGRLRKQAQHASRNARNRAKSKQQPKIGKKGKQKNINHKLRSKKQPPRFRKKNFRKVGLRGSDLSRLANDYRKENNLWHDGNVVVIEYLDLKGKLRRMIQSTEPASKKHAERLALDSMKSAGIPMENIQRIYSELALCELESGGVGQGGCKKMVLNEVGVDIEISYSYEYPGTDITTKALREGSRRQRRSDFELYK